MYVSKDSNNVNPNNKTYIHNYVQVNLTNNDIIDIWILKSSSEMEQYYLLDNSVIYFLSFEESNKKYECYVSNGSCLCEIERRNPAIPIIGWYIVVYAVSLISAKMITEKIALDYCQNYCQNYCESTYEFNDDDEWMWKKIKASLDEGFFIECEEDVDEKLLTICKGNCQTVQFLRTERETEERARLVDCENE